MPSSSEYIMTSDYIQEKLAEFAANGESGKITVEISLVDGKPSGINCHFSVTPDYKTQFPPMVQIPRKPRRIDNTPANEPANNAQKSD